MSDKPETLRDQIEAAFETVVESSREPEPESEPDVVEEVREPVEAAESAPSSDESEETPTDNTEAPIHWSPEDREVFNELDEKGRKLYLKRHKEMEASYTKKSQMLSEEKRVAERFKKTIEPYQEFFRKNNIDEFDAFQRAATAHMRLTSSSPQEKTALLNKLAMDYGVNLGVPNPYQQQSQQQAPQIDQVTQSILEQLNQQNQYITKIQQERQHQEEYTINKTIENFATAKDSSGELKYPHFDTVRTEMGHLLSAGLADSIEKAYDKAIKLNEDLHQEYINRQYNTRMRSEDAAKKTVASKRAGFNVKGGGGQLTEPKQTLTTRQLLEQTYDAQIRRQRI